MSIGVASLLMPWHILANPRGYLRKFVLGYSMFTGSTLAIQVCDYYLIRKQMLSIDGLYDGKPGGLYYYSGGYNARAWLALVVGSLPCIPGESTS